MVILLVPFAFSFLHSINFFSFFLQLAACEFYIDFLLLDPCDARSINDFLNATPDKGKNSDTVNPGRTIKSKNRQSAYKSPSARKSSQRKNKENEYNMDDGVNLEDAFEFEAGGNDANWNNNDYDMGHQDAPDFGGSDGGDDSEGDEDDPWKPLNPHEPGTLRIKPFKKGIFFL
jgi:condensin-2 complex subunit H2